MTNDFSCPGFFLTKYDGRSSYNVLQNVWFEMEDRKNEKRKTTTDVDRYDRSVDVPDRNRNLLSADLRIFCSCLIKRRRQLAVRHLGICGDGIIAAADIDDQIFPHAACDLDHLQAL